MQNFFYDEIHQKIKKGADHVLVLLISLQYPNPVSGWMKAQVEGEVFF